RSGTVYKPVASVATARATPVATLVSVTLTLGIAACEASITVPDRTPPDTCAFRPMQRTLENASTPAARRAISVPCLPRRFLTLLGHTIIPYLRRFQSGRRHPGVQARPKENSGPHANGRRDVCPQRIVVWVILLDYADKPLAAESINSLALSGDTENPLSHLEVDNFDRILTLSE